jgi:arylsulfatase A-like enzyme
MDRRLGIAKKVVPGYLYPLSIALIIGFLFGCYKATRSIYVNEYVQYGMYNACLFTFRGIVTKWALLIPFIVAILQFGALATYSLMKIKFRSEKKSLDFLVALVLSSVFLLIGVLVNYRFGFFGFYTPAGLAYITGVLIVAIILMVFLKILLFRINYEWAGRIYSRFSGFKKSSKVVSVCVTIFLIFLNIAVFGYKKANVPHGPNVLLIVVDTLRSDHLGSYGYVRKTSPNIDRLARESILFKSSISQAPWTLPSVATILTSLYPSVHEAKDFSRKLSSRLITLPEILMDHFYETGGIISGDFVSSHYGFDQGFGFFDEESICGHKGISSPSVSKKAIGFLRKKKKEKFFLFLHYFDPHFNYVSHDKYHYSPNYTGRLSSGEDIGELRKMRNNLSPDDIDYLVALYDGEISFTDEYIGFVLEELKALNLYDNTLIILTADHGEEFMERGWLGHSTTLYSEQIAVPLILKSPKRKKGLSFDNHVGLIDIMPTALELCGIEKNDKMVMQGVNLLELIEGRTLREKGAVFSEVSYIDEGIRAFKQSAVWKQWKITRNMKDNSYELYNIELDRDERNNLLGNNKVVFEQMKDLLAQWERTNHGIVAKKGAHDTVIMEGQLKSRLKSLGYIN